MHLNSGKKYKKCLTAKRVEVGRTAELGGTEK